MSPRSKPDPLASIRPEQFFTELFGTELPSGTSIVVWSTKGIAWCDSPSAAARKMLEMDAEGSVDVYFGCCLQRTSAKGAGKRGEAATAGAMGGVWVDLDVANATHKKKGLPPSMKDAQGVIDALPIQPTIVIETGGGLHAWWMLREPFVIETPDDNARCSAAVAGWQALIRSLMAARGWKMDSTHDLARVLRAPGTRNRKYGEARSTVRFADFDRRFNLDDFSEWADIGSAGAEPEQTRQHQTIQIGSLTLSPDANPPLDKFTQTCEVQSRFLQTFNGQRKDLESASERDLSLASMAVHCGWTDQETINLLIASRRKNGDDPKLRIDYYARTLGRARQERAGDAAFERLADRVSGSNQAVPPESGSTDQRAALADITATLGLDIVRIIKYPGEPPLYRLVLREGSIDLGHIEAIVNGSTFRNRVADVTKRLVPRMKQDRWDTVAQAILQSVEDADLGSESSHERSMEALLREYLSRYRPGRDRDGACAQKLPFIIEGEIMVSAGHLRQYVMLGDGDRVAKREMARRLKMFGCTPHVVGWTKTNGASTTIYTWALPRLEWVGDILADAPLSNAEREPGSDG